MKDFLQEAALVKPSKRQMDWFDTEFYAFIHFSPNTYTNLEWGNGTEPESIFNPVKLDCNQWVEAIKAAGMKGMVLTAKHHDGFCLWPSKYTEHSVKNSPVKRDIVMEAAKACKKGGIKFGFYLSPWDRNSPYYGTPQYNDYFCNQLTELLTEYGEIFYVWFDNACGEGPNGKKQEYDFPRYFSLIRKYQPNAVIFNDFGPDVRWCGNEAGIARYAEWSVVPSELCHYSEVQTGPGPLAGEGDLSYMYNTDQNIGSMSNILYSKGLVYAPAEIDTSIRPGWFWHPQEEPYSLEHLCKIYLSSVGANAALNLNIPPNRDGLLDERDVKRLKELGEWIRKEFGKELSVEVEKEGNLSQPVYSIPLSVPYTSIRYVVLEEDIAKGQRIESFRIYVDEGSGNKHPLYQGTCVGHKKICQLIDPFQDQNPLTNDLKGAGGKLMIQVTAARGEVCMKNIRVYG